MYILAGNSFLRLFLLPVEKPLYIYIHRLDGPWQYRLVYLNQPLLLWLIFHFPSFLPLRYSQNLASASPSQIRWHFSLPCWGSGVLRRR